MTYQTFSLDAGAQLLITRALLDRFLACMKPASITLRPPCAGVFFWAFAQFLDILDVTGSRLRIGSAHNAFIGVFCRCSNYIRLNNLSHQG
jgi:hypothetical protein